MVLDDETNEEIKQVFEGVFSNKESASDLIKSAGDIMKGLAERIAGRSGEDSKLILKSLKKAYKEFAESKNSEADTLSDAILIINAVVPKTE